MGQQLPVVEREHAQQLELVRGQVHRARRPTRDRALLEIDDELADRDHAARPTAPTRRSTARSRASSSSIADRLGDVVVGAGVERGDLLALLADRREEDHGHRAPCAQLAADVDAGAVGKDEVEDHRVRRSQRRRSRAPPRRSRRCRPRSPRRAGSSAARAGSAARRRRRGCAWPLMRRPATRCDAAARGRTSRPARRATRPRCARRWPRRSPARSRDRARRPRRRSPAAALERLEDALELAAAATPGPVVDHAHDRLRRRRRRPAAAPARRAAST